MAKTMMKVLATGEIVSPVAYAGEKTLVEHENRERRWFPSQFLQYATHEEIQPYYERLEKQATEELEEGESADARERRDPFAPICRAIGMVRKGRYEPVSMVDPVAEALYHYLEKYDLLKK